MLVGKVQKTHRSSLHVARSRIPGLESCGVVEDLRLRKFSRKAGRNDSAKGVGVERYGVEMPSTDCRTDAIRIESVT